MVYMIRDLDAVKLFDSEVQQGRGQDKGPLHMLVSDVKLFDTDPVSTWESPIQRCSQFDWLRYNVLQLARDLGGNQWLQCDKSFRKWAATKNVRV